MRSQLPGREAGFVHVLNEKILVYPEYRGNGVMASLGNIVENPHAGLLFVDFIRDKVGLHVNGAAAHRRGRRRVAADVSRGFRGALMVSATVAAIGVAAALVRGDERRPLPARAPASHRA